MSSSASSNQRLADVQEQVDQVVDIMSNNTNRLLKRDTAMQPGGSGGGIDPDALNRLQENAERFKATRSTHRRTQRQAYRLTVIFMAAVLSGLALLGTGLAAHFGGFPLSAPGTHALIGVGAGLAGLAVLTMIKNCCR